MCSGLTGKPVLLRCVLYFIFLISIGRSREGISDCESQQGSTGKTSGNIHGMLPVLSEFYRWEASIFKRLPVRQDRFQWGDETDGRFSFCVCFWQSRPAHAWRSYDLTAHCKSFPSYQDRAAETASSIAGFLIERLEVLLCSWHQT